MAGATYSSANSTFASRARRQWLIASICTSTTRASGAARQTLATSSAVMVMGSPSRNRAAPAFTTTTSGSWVSSASSTSGQKIVSPATYRVGESSALTTKPETGGADPVPVLRLAQDGGLPGDEIPRPLVPVVVVEVRYQHQVGLFQQGQRFLVPKRQVHERVAPLVRGIGHGDRGPRGGQHGIHHHLPAAGLEHERRVPHEAYTHGYLPPAAWS